ncbi:FAD-dependent oxidoreductase [Shewanella fidelis]|uniref:FAD-dependent oxidoreductase n=1 Tax=Shewanella fidelis TaxID=173509 RepID=A0AAW8NMJ5_9GAMM|nr:FAD-dependent oxidoreductase [Shewanella fidelis]MDR8524428.1 FAD-dependent oxidoreductase [Shewanella fidelis]MDW4811904.1 FAD-dependent oxidoreductase [Shewanella fidelis]MDW4817157.1 FAD-dependent oxidoreductase [Shewanella fidelis]MDW4821227.1 FAD-dependent oxidoreductase [Shewanella fidelis]MDW4822510.1 FAD-dependent oxidoreductase [Shewanella fidelis]
MKSSVAIIGGGFFGLYIARHMAQRGFQVDLFEKEKEGMLRSSYVNQARIHNGYHYPRSILTASRSHESFARFCHDFDRCVVNDFEKYYAIGKKLGKVSANQFSRFCAAVDIRCDQAPLKVRKLFNPLLVEEVFSVDEYAFDFIKLREQMLEKLTGTDVNIQYESFVNNVEFIDENCLRLNVISSSNHVKANKEYEHVFNCTYASINHINSSSGIKAIPLIHELTEMVLVDPPEELKNLGITLMCGPFFSVMPFPSTPYHSTTHVRYTPREEYDDSSKIIGLNSRGELDNLSSTAWPYIINDVCRYIPSMENSVYKKSLWDVKTILPSSSNDDSRPILFKPNHAEIKGYHCIMGGKIDNVFDAVDCIDREVLGL